MQAWVVAQRVAWTGPEPSRAACAVWCMQQGLAVDPTAPAPLCAALQLHPPRPPDAPACPCQRRASRHGHGRCRAAGGGEWGEVCWGPAGSRAAGTCRCAPAAGPRLSIDGVRAHQATTIDAWLLTWLPRDIVLRSSWSVGGDFVPCGSRGRAQPALRWAGTLEVSRDPYRVPELAQKTDEGGGCTTRRANSEHSRSLFDCARMPEGDEL